MRRVVLSVAVLLVLAVTLNAAAKSESWTGWVSDSACASKDTSMVMKADHKGCAAKCVKEKGAKWVFVDSKSKSVLAIHNQDAVKESDLGHEVVVTGTMSDDKKSIHVDSVKAKS